MKYDIEKTGQFDRWFRKLKDSQVKARIGLRFKRVEQGNFGDHKQIDQNLFELRFFFGSGFRVYYTIKNFKVVLLINGGDKASQQEDIAKAKSLLNLLEEQDNDH